MGVCPRCGEVKTRIPEIPDEPELGAFLRPEEETATT